MPPNIFFFSQSTLLPLPFLFCLHRVHKAGKDFNAQSCTPILPRHGSMRLRFTARFVQHVYIAKHKNINLPKGKHSLLTAVPIQFISFHLCLFFSSHKTLPPPLYFVRLFFRSYLLLFSKMAAIKKKSNIAFIFNHNGHLCLRRSIFLDPYLSPLLLALISSFVAVAETCRREIKI